MLSGNLDQLKNIYAKDGRRLFLKINSRVLDGYLEDGHIGEAQKDSMVAHVINNVIGAYQDDVLTYSSEEQKIMRRMADDVKAEIKDFTPNNEKLWNLLYPNWREIISEVTVHLLVGLPKNYDALAIDDEKGNPTIVYDMGNWVIYQNLNVGDVVQNLLTHELAHVCNYDTYPKLKEISLMGYLEKLNAISFDEGFAHLLSFENKEISSIDWQEDRFEKIFRESLDVMKEALLENDSSKHDQFIEKSMIGSFHEKFGAMVGMMYLAKQWMKHGDRSVKNLFDEGHQKFLDSILESTTNNS